MKRRHVNVQRSVWKSAGASGDRESYLKREKIIFMKHLLSKKLFLRLFSKEMAAGGEKIWRYTTCTCLFAHLLLRAPRIAARILRLSACTLIRALCATLRGLTWWWAGEQNDVVGDDGVGTTEWWTWRHKWRSRRGQPDAGGRIGCNSRRAGVVRAAVRVERAWWTRNGAVCFSARTALLCRATHICAHITHQQGEKQWKQLANESERRNSIVNWKWKKISAKISRICLAKISARKIGYQSKWRKSGGKWRRNENENGEKLMAALKAAWKAKKINTWRKYGNHIGANGISETRNWKLANKIWKRRNNQKSVKAGNQCKWKSAWKWKLSGENMAWSEMKAMKANGENSVQREMAYLRRKWLKINENQQRKRRKYQAKMKEMAYRKWN